MPERDASMIYKLNEKANFKVSTPAGITKEIKVKEIVKQGTVFGPKLCCASTGKINDGLEIEEVVYPTVSVKAVTFVDDIDVGDPIGRTHLSWKTSCVVGPNLDLK